MARDRSEGEEAIRRARASSATRGGKRRHPTGCPRYSGQRRGSGFGDVKSGGNYSGPREPCAAEGLEPMCAAGAEVAAKGRARGVIQTLNRDVHQAVDTQVSVSGETRVFHEGDSLPSISHRMICTTSCDSIAHLDAPGRTWNTAQHPDERSATHEQGGRQDIARTSGFLTRMIAHCVACRLSGSARRTLRAAFGPRAV